MGYTSTCTSRLFQYSNFDVLSECDFSPNLTNALSASHTSPRDHLVISKNLSFSSDVFTEEDKVEDKAEKMEEVEVEVEERGGGESDRKSRRPRKQRGRRGW